MDTTTVTCAQGGFLAIRPGDTLYTYESTRLSRFFLFLRLRRLAARFVRETVIGRVVEVRSDTELVVK